MRQSSASFARRDALHRWKLQFGPNMTPMVDIVLVILIFFMATAAFMGEEWFLEAAIPNEIAGGGASATEALELPPWTIHVRLEVGDGSGTIASAPQLAIERQPVERVIERISALPADAETATTQVMISPAAGVPYRDVVRVHEATAAVGITKIGIGLTSSAP